MMDSRLPPLLKKLGISALRPMQSLVIGQILEAAQVPNELEKRRVVILPTGYGKTLCFALPALLLPDPTLIIYPLRALMADQSRRFESMGISSVLLQGGLGAMELGQRLRAIQDRNCRIILANPEILASIPVRRVLENTKISHIVVDEAHVIHQWGNSFRPAYRNLAACIATIDVDQVSAFTATADVDTREAIRNFLGNSSVAEFSGPVDRPEIRYRVIRSPMPELSLQGLLWGTGLGQSQAPIAKPALVFVRNRSLCEQLSLHFRHLDAHCQGQIRFYHAGLSHSERWHLEHWFHHSSTGVLVSTNAYGLGVDKPDIRTVIHLGLPDSAVAYLQESGRAARDGRIAEAICISQSGEKDSEDQWLNRYLAGNECRRIPLLEAVLDKPAECGGCDICQPGNDSAPPEVHAIQEFLRKNKGQYTIAELGKALHRAGLLGILGQIQLDCLLRSGLQTGWLRKSFFPLSWKRIMAGS